MVRRIPEGGISPIGLMRAVSSNFDDNVAVIDTEDALLISGGIPMATLTEKARLLSGMQFILSSAMPSSSDLVEQENMHLRNENTVLRDTLRRMEERLSSVEASLPKRKLVILREVSKEEARREIRDLFSTGKTLYYSDIAQELGLELETVVAICNELQEQGEIATDAGVPQSR